MNFVTEGVYKDDNMPDLQEYRALTMGIRISSDIDVSPAFNVIGEINSGVIGWFARPIEGTEVQVFSSVDGGSSWDSLVNGEYMQNASALNDSPTLKLKYIIKSTIAQIRPEKTPKLYNVVVVLSEKERKFWGTMVDDSLTWKEGSPEDLTW